MELLANIDVDDLAVATDFYCRALNLTVGRRFGGAAIELLGASSAIYLLQKAEGTHACNAPASTRHYSRHWTPVHLDFVVPDLDEACRKAQAAGATPEGPVRSHAWGHIAMFADPFGHGFCLVQFLNRGYDEIASQP